MDAIGRKTAFIVGTIIIVCFIAGCGEHDRTPKELAPALDLGATIGSLTTVLAPESILIEGYGIVGGLKGTGSAECPPQIRAYLKRYILTQLPSQRMIDVEKFINSPETAVVLVEGMMPEIASKNQYFDVRVTALQGTQTTSLDGGWLFNTELKIAGTFGVSTRILADAEGPIYIDKIDTTRMNQRTGYILAGGKVLDEYIVTLVLNRPDFMNTNIIRNRLNELFGGDIARAIVPGRIEVTVPAKYKQQKQRFISIVRAMYLTQGPEINSERIRTFVRELAVADDKYASEIALEAIGKESLGKLGILLKSSGERVRLHAARCMLNLGSDAGLVTLRQIAMDKASAYRLEALESITMAAKRNDAAAISQKLLRDDDFQIRLAAYEQLRKLDDVAVAREFVGRSFYLERIAQNEHKTVFVSRSGQPRIVLFGAPIHCYGNIFVRSVDGDITINAPSGQPYVTIIRKHPKRPSVIAQLRSTFELGDIIKTLCDEPPEEGEKRRGGLGVSYADAIILLKQMCDRGAVQAQFRAGPLPKIGPIIKK